MLSFFSPKSLLVDKLEEFTDIHNHILPGIDDGADTAEDSLQLLYSFRKIGITNLICTPHTMGDYHPNTLQTINQAREVLQQHLKTANISDFKIRASSEYMMDSEFLEILETGQILPLKTNYLLVEMSFLQAPINLEEILFKIANSGYIPVLAHPERYSFLHHKYDYYAELKRLGCLFQLNALALGNYYGKEVNRVALKLLKDNSYDFLGTDVHHSRHIEQLKKVEISKKHEDAVSRLITNTISTFS